MTIILGINAYHGDSSACLVVDGKLIAAAEEERFRRIKHWAGFPSEAIRYCLDEAGITLADVAYVAINSDPKANLMKKIGFTLKKRPELGLIMDRLKNQSERRSIEQELKAAFPEQELKGQVKHVEHHLAHLSSAFHVSPYGEACIVSVDGFGDFASAAWGMGRGTEISIDDKVYFPYSLGTFYQALTQFIGFPNYGDEYKVMGLAPYGKPEYLDEMRQIVLLQDEGSFRLNMDYFIYHKEKIDYEWENGSPSVGRLFSDKLAELLGPVREKGDELTQKHMDIAHSVQAMYEEAFFHLLGKLHAKHGNDNLCIAGGCGMNSVANGKVTLRSPFKNVYIQSAAGDAGGAIGAAFVVHHQMNPKAGRSFVMDHAFWGNHFSEAEMREALDVRCEDLKQKGCVVELIDDEAQLCRRTAQAVSEGKVIGWFQGRMEWGPRALGNRSIVCDPRRSDMKDILNLKIKRRESFRPFAPSILREAVSDWFEEDDEVPFMMKVFQIREEKRTEIPAVTHADGSGRLQTVYEKTNPRYHRLIKSFGELTGVPIVLNTSFNENEPVVCQPSEALDCFLRTKMDVLVLGDWFIERKN
ncbi:MAG: carbamoyltransferase C-terminal domain-containing protein [Mariprofundaceae bacterium]|nr:carbamoyltransferase C-terminal domain-containing protein [Mariprofundaceae bacterium]